MLLKIPQSGSHLNASQIAIPLLSDTKITHQEFISGLEKLMAEL